MRPWIAGAVAASLLLVGGCSSARPASPSDGSRAISAQQQRALQSGSITETDYQEGFEAFRDCLARAGFQLVDPHLVADEYDYQIPAAAVDSGESDRCYQFYWEQVDGEWQVAHDHNSDDFTRVVQCLKDHGLTPTSMSKKNVELLEQHKIDIASC